MPDKKHPLFRVIARPGWLVINTNWPMGNPIMGERVDEEGPAHVSPNIPKRVDPASETGTMKVSPPKRGDYDAGESKFMFDRGKSSKN